MDQKQLDALTSNLSKMTDRLHAPLHAIALIRLVDTFYPSEQRTALLKQIDDAYAACRVAYEAVNAGTPKESGWSEEQKATHRRLMDAKIACDAVVDGLRKEHKLLFRLREAKESLSKGKYD